MSENTKDTKTETQPDTKTETKTETTTAPDTQPDTKTQPEKQGNKKKEKRVDVFIPRGNANDDPNVFVSINGVNYILPKGKTSSVPVSVKKELERSKKAQAISDEHIDEMTQPK